MPDSIKVGIVGSRDFADPKIVKDFVWQLPQECTVVSGGARGVDTIAETEARARGWEPIIHPPAVKSRYADKRAVAQALLERNGLIVRDSDVIVAFWDGKSAGTLDTITKARHRDKRVFIIYNKSMPYLVAIDAIKHLVDIQKGVVNARG